MTASVTSTGTSSLNMQLEDVADKMFTHINRESPELNIFGLVTRQLDGRYYRVDFQTDGNPYMASRAEDEFLPGYDPAGTAEDQMADFTVGEMKFRHRSHYMSTDFTGQMKAVVKSKKGGYMNLADFRFKDTTEFMKERIGIKIAGSSLGTIARLKGAVTTTTAAVHYAGYSAASTQTWENGARYLRKGLVVDCTNGGRAAALCNSTNDRGRRITNVAVDTGTSAAGVAVTLNSAPTTWPDGGYLVIYNERPTGAISGTGFDTLKNPLGILDAIDDGSIFTQYGELARASYPTLNALVFGNSSPGVLRNLNQQIINFAVERKNQIPGGGGKIDVAYSTFGVMRQFVDALTIMGSGSSGATATNNPMRFNNPGASPQKIGFNSFEIYPLGMTGKLTCMPSRLAPHHSLFLLQRDTAILLQDGPPRYINEDGMTIRKTVGKDVFTADWVWRATGIVCREPWKNIRIDDLNGDHMTL